jgi:uncharacterized protein (TIGR02391 family)
MPVEDVAEILFNHLMTIPDGGNEVHQFGRFNQTGYLNTLKRLHQYVLNDGAERVLLEAWSWLEAEGLIAPINSISGTMFFITRRGKAIKTRSDFDSYRRSRLLPKEQVHSSVVDEVFPIFQRGKYDMAVFAAFRAVEIAVREAGKYPAEMIGEQLMGSASQSAENNRPAGPLTDQNLPISEQKSMAKLFAGAMGLYRNSTGHRYVPTKAEEAAEVILMASHLLRIVDRLKR